MSSFVESGKGADSPIVFRELHGCRFLRGTGAAITVSNSRELVNRALQFHERSQHFIGAHDETLSVICSVQPSRFSAGEHSPLRYPLRCERVLAARCRLRKRS